LKTALKEPGEKQNCGFNLSRHQPRCALHPVFTEKGGGGVFFAKNASYVVDEVWVASCTLGGFARFCDTFGDILARGNGKDWAGLCGLPPLPQEQGHGEDGAPSFQRLLWGPRRFFGYFFHGIRSPQD